MLFAILLPLLVSWLFRKSGSKKIYLTYLVSGLLIVVLPLFLLIINIMNAVAIHGSPDTIALAAGLSEMVGGMLINLFITLFFQYIFNKTFGLTSKA